MNSVLRRFERVALLGLFVVGVTQAASAQQPADRPLGAAPAVAVVNVNLIRMDRDRVEPGQTVVVQGDRIAALGAAGEVVVPDAAMVIDGTNRYLLPGLTDAHVHLLGFLPGLTRDDFGDAPLYLANGVTTVVNLGGTATELEWRQRIAAGDLLGPTIYTSGPFVNEPRVNTPDEVQHEVVTQARQGYDLIKFHELPGTTTGLSLAAYRTMNETAREVGIPLVGHAPNNLGLDVMLEARQSLAHVGNLGNLYFLPLQANVRFLMVSATALVLLIVVVLAWAGAALVDRLRQNPPRRPPTFSRVRTTTVWVLLASVAGFAFAVLVYPGGPLFDSLTLRVMFTIVALFIAVAALLLSVLTARLWRDGNATTFARIQASLVSIAALALAFCLATFWVPVSWRSSDRGIERVAARIHNAGISVQTTLINYETFSTTGRSRLLNDPGINYLRSETRDRWRRQPQAGIPGYRYDQFMKKVTGALHRAGVPLVAGTDAMGLPLIAPGTSLHRELELLTESGLTPYEAIRAATVAPAVFLRKDNEFGSLDVGKRADLLLLEGNPLQDVAQLKQLVGVMVRGKWLPREHLQQMLADLVRKE
jgi:MFS family permease